MAARRAGRSRVCVWLSECAAARPRPWYEDSDTAVVTTCHLVHAYCPEGCGPGCNESASRLPRKWIYLMRQHHGRSKARLVFRLSRYCTTSCTVTSLPNLIVTRRLSESTLKWADTNPSILRARTVRTGVVSHLELFPSFAQCA
jgi:hypothetical protein